MRLQVSIEKNGIMTPAGHITGSSSKDAVFQYDETYMRNNGSALSLSLPLQSAAFSSEETQRYFEGLLPEGFTRRSVAQWMHTTEDNYPEILYGLGRECLGAIQITHEGETFEEAYELVTEEDIRQLAEEGASKSAEIVVKAHLSLTGASGKVGLYYGNNSSWYLPIGTAPSTHIVKQSHVRLESIVPNEQLTLLTAQKCGIRTAGQFILNVGSGRDDEILLASVRFDRTFDGSCHKINGFPVPLRLHQEDFAQALGISSADKYERPGDQHMKKAFELLRKHSSSPIEDQLQLWDMICFNFLVGNTDGHIKNFSLLYSPDLHSLRLAPAYDMVSTVIYPQCTRDLAFSIGNEYHLDAITPEHFRSAAAEAGLGEKMAMKRFYTLAGKFRNALTDAAATLNEQGIPDIDKIRNEILAQGGCHILQP